MSRASESGPAGHGGGRTHRGDAEHDRIGRRQVEHAGFELPTDGSAYEPYQSDINLSAVPEDTIFRLRKRAYRRFYLNPRRAWQIFKLIPNKSNMLLFARRACAR